MSEMYTNILTTNVGCEKQLSIMINRYCLQTCVNIDQEDFKKWLILTTCAKHYSLLGRKYTTDYDDLRRLIDALSNNPNSFDIYFDMYCKHEGFTAIDVREEGISQFDPKDFEDILKDITTNDKMDEVLNKMDEYIEFGFFPVDE